MTGDGGARDQRRPSETIVRLVATEEGVEPTELRCPLDDVVDTDALDSIFEPRLDGEPRGEGHVEFEYCGYSVTVTADGTVDVEPLTE